MKKHKWLVVSLAVNLCFILFFGFLYIKGLSIQEFNMKLIQSVNASNQSEYPSYYQEKISQFKSFSVNCNSIVFLGDSIVDMGDWQKFFPNNDVINMGINSDTIQGVINRIDIIGNPDKIFIMVGTNDLSGNEPISVLADKYQDMIDRIRGQSPDSKIYIQSVLPVNSGVWKKSSEVNFRQRSESNTEIKQFNKEISKLADNKTIFYVDLYPLFEDEKGNMSTEYSVSGLHLNGQGYKVWVDTTRKYVEE